MTDEELLAEYRKQYEHATIETHMLVDGKLYQRCHVCFKNPLIVFGNVMWCDQCLDEYLSGNHKGLDAMCEFIARKRAES